MKKNLQRVLAAAVAVPVALSQALAINTFAADDAATTLSLTSEQLLRAKTTENFPSDAADTLSADGVQTITFEQSSNWNETLAGILAGVSDDTTVTVATSDLAAILGGTSYYADILKSVLEDSSDATATYDATNQTVTIKGSLDFESYLQKLVDEELASNDAYADIDIQLDVDALDYELGVDLDTTGKTVAGTASFTAGSDTYTLTTLGDYMTDVYEDVVAQIDAIVSDRLTTELAKLDTAVAEAQAEIDAAQAEVDAAQAELDEAVASGADTTDAQAKVNDAQAKVDDAQKQLDEAYANASADAQAQIDDVYAAVDEEKAALKETTDGLQALIEQFTEYVALAPTATLRDGGTYATGAEAYTAIRNNLINKFPTLASNLPEDVSAAVSQYASQFTSVVDVVNDALAEASVNAEISVTSDDIATLIAAEKNVTAETATPGVLDVTFEIPDSDTEVAEVTAYVESQDVADQLDLDTLTTTKTVYVTIDATNGTMTYDVVRVVEVSEKEVEETTTTTTETTEDTSDTTETTTETPVATDTTVTTDTTDTTDDTDTTTDSTDSTDDTTDTTETTASTDDTSDTESTTTTIDTDDTSDTDDSTETTDSTSDTDDTTDTTETTASTDDTTGTTTTDNGGTDTTTAVPADQVASISIELKDLDASEGLYFDTEEAYDAEDLIDAVVITEKDGTVVEVSLETIEFLSTPSADYASVNDGDLVYYYDTTAIQYNDGQGGTVAIDEDCYPTVGVAKKGDSDLDGEVTVLDARDTLVYYAETAVNGIGSVTFLDGDDAFLERLAYFVSDVDTESKNGVDEEDGDGKSITVYDASYILNFYALNSAGNNPVWADILG